MGEHNKKLSWQQGVWGLGGWEKWEEWEGMGRGDGLQNIYNFSLPAQAGLW
jgi:hypothetical protein